MPAALEAAPAIQRGERGRGQHRLLPDRCRSICRALPGRVSPGAGMGSAGIWSRSPSVPSGCSAARYAWRSMPSRRETRLIQCGRSHDWPEAGVCCCDVAPWQLRLAQGVHPVSATWGSIAATSGIDWRCSSSSWPPPTPQGGAALLLDGRRPAATGAADRSRAVTGVSSRCRGPPAAGRAGQASGGAAPRWRGARSLHLRSGHPALAGSAALSVQRARSLPPRRAARQRILLQRAGWPAVYGMAVELEVKTADGQLLEQSGCCLTPGRRPLACACRRMRLGRWTHHPQDIRQAARFGVNPSWWRSSCPVRLKLQLGKGPDGELQSRSRPSRLTAAGGLPLRCPRRAAPKAKAEVR